MRGGIFIWLPIPLVRDEGAVMGGYFHRGVSCHGPAFGYVGARACAFVASEVLVSETTEDRFRELSRIGSIRNR